MPSSPAWRRTANVRYGLHDGSGQRSSIRVAFSLPGWYMGTRTSAERLRRDHAMYTGASYPGTSRLYEFTDGANSAASSRACLSWPAMNDFATPDRWY